MVFMITIHMTTSVRLNVMCAGAAMLMSQTARWLVCRSKKAEENPRFLNMLYMCLYKTCPYDSVSIRLTNLDGRGDCTRPSFVEQMMVPLLNPSPQSCLHKLSPVSCCSCSSSWYCLLSLCLLSVFSTSVGLLEERAGQRPPVSHRGVSPQGQCLSGYLPFGSQVKDELQMGRKIKIQCRLKPVQGHLPIHKGLKKTKQQQSILFIVFLWFLYV